MKTVTYTANHLLSCAKCNGEIVICIDEALTVSTKPYIDAVVASTVEAWDSCGKPTYVYGFTYDEYQLLDPLVDLLDLNIDGVFCRGCLTAYIDANSGGYVPPTPLSVNYYAVNVTASQVDTVLVAAVAGKKIRVIKLAALCGALATNITFNSKGGGAGTAISMTFSNGPNSGVVLAGGDEDGWFETVVSEALTVTTGAGTTTGIQIVYAEI